MCTSNTSQQPCSMDPALRAWLARREAEGDPILTQSLLAVGENEFHERHFAPQQALKALADIFHSHNEATFQARRHGVALDDFAIVQPGSMAYLLGVIAGSMQMGECQIDAALRLREASQQAKAQGA